MKTRVRYCVDAGIRSCAAAYALRTLLQMILPSDCLVSEIPGEQARTDEVVVTYGGSTEHVKGGIRVFRSGFFGKQFGSADVLPQRPVVRLQNIAALYRDVKGPSDRFYSVQNDNRDTWVDCHVDIVAGTFLMLSRYEETVIRSVDRFARFPAGSSIAFQEGFLQEPVVNQYAEQLLQMLRAAGFTGERRTWWNDAPWAIALTHDVDKMKHFPMSALNIARYVTGRVPEGTPGLDRLLRDYAQTVTRRKKDEYDCLPEMAAWEAEIGVHAAYYFLGDAKGLHGADYAAGTPEVTASMKAVADMGHEVGFHAGFWAYEDARRFHEELSKVRSAGIPVHGGRHHYLRWKTPITWRLWENEGLAYDSTLGYSAVGGFRCGTCLPFHPYDIENDREMSILEWPLMFMDSTYELCWPEGMKMLDNLSDVCRRYGGVLVALWHSQNWSSLYASQIRDCFQNLLKRCVVQGASVGSIADLTQLSGTASGNRKELARG